MFLKVKNYKNFQSKSTICLTLYVIENIIVIEQVNILKLLLFDNLKYF